MEIREEETAFKLGTSYCYIKAVFLNGRVTGC